MKRSINIYIIVVLALVCSSCDGFFELDRPNQYPWTSIEELELGIRTPYRTLCGNAWNSPLGTLGLKGFAESDIAQLVEGPVGDNLSKSYYNWEYSKILPDKEIDNCFDYLFQMVSETNAVLQLLNKADSEGEDPFEGMNQADRELVNHYRGEALFMRALAYWYLARMYAPPFDPNGANDGKYFVLRREFVNNDEELKHPELGTVGEVWAAIQEDLENAKKNLSEDYKNNEINPKGRVNKFAASAMLARVYFITGQHDKAKSECDYILASDKYNLNDDPIVAFERTGGVKDCSEIIWEIAYNAESTAFDRIPTIFSKCNYNARNGGRGKNFSRASWANLTMSYSTLKEIGWMEDGLNGNYTETEEARRDKRYQQVYCRLEEYKELPDGLSADEQAEWKDKYETTYPIPTPMIWQDKHYRAEDGRRSNRPMIRLAEVYLTRSILLFNAGNKQAAADDLNAVRNRAGLDNISAADITADKIHNERIKEMAGEHADRTYYLIGLRLPIGIGDRDPGKFSPIQAPYANYFWQVPLREQELNQAY